MSTRIRRIPVRYRSNPSNLGGKRWEGRKTWDQTTGFHTYEYRLTTDDYGSEVDPRFDNFDVNERS